LHALIEEHTAAEPKYMSSRKYEQVHGSSASFCWKRKTTKEKSSAQDSHSTEEEHEEHSKMGMKPKNEKQKIAPQKLNKIYI
jgi:hypothetical protein